MDLATSERKKYERMWAQPAYHLGSPGERSVSKFVQLAPLQPGESVVDAGCGGGRAGTLLELAGLKVTLLDFCRSAIEPAAAHLPFIDAVLWDLPPLIFDWIYCVDVLEHIPPEKVEAVLDGLQAMGKKGGYVQICCVQDNCGSLIGEVLHLTVEPPSWWRERIAARWPILHDLSADVYASFVVGVPR